MSRVPPQRENIPVKRSLLCVVAPVVDRLAVMLGELLLDPALSTFSKYPADAMLPAFYSITNRVRNVVAELPFPDVARVKPVTPEGMLGQYHASPVIKSGTLELLM